MNIVSANFVLTIYKSHLSKIMMPSSFSKRRGEKNSSSRFKKTINIKSLVPRINLLDLSANRVSYPVN